VLDELEYDEDTDTDCRKDLEMLLCMWKEKLGEQGIEFYK
jgi:hypothetical protein